MSRLKELVYWTKNEKERFGPGLEVISEGETRIGLRPIPRKREAARRVHTYDAWHLWGKRLLLGFHCGVFLPQFHVLPVAWASG